MVSMRKNKKTTNVGHVLDLFPKKAPLTEVSILSIYELIAYLTVFLLCGWLFLRWNHVNTRQYDVHVERIDALGDTLSNNVCIALTIPMTTDKEENEGWHSIQRIPSDEDGNMSTYWNRISRSPKSGHVTTLMENYQDKIAQLKDRPTPRYFVKMETPLLNSQLTGTRFERLDSIGYRKLDFERKGLVVKKISSVFIGNDNLIGQIIPDSFVASSPLNRPRWHSTFDVSQFYVKYHVTSHTTDELVVRFDFIGPCEISNLGGQNCEISSHGVEYRFTPNDFGEIDQELSFYVRCKGLENLQSVRNFFIGAFLSGLLMLLLTFMVILTYRLFHIKKVQEETGSEEAEEIQE